MSTFDREAARKNIRRLFYFSFFNWFLILIPVVVPFLKSKGLTMTDVYWLNVIFSGGVVLLEVPSGYLSDIWGRKKTLILSSLFAWVGAGALLVADSFWDFAVFEVALAVAASLRSGTDISLLYDSTYAAEPQHFSQTSMMGKFMLVNSGSETLASLLGGVLALWSLQYPVWAFAGALIIPFFIALGLEEPPRQRMDQHSHWHNFKSVVRHLTFQDPLVRRIFFNNMVWSSATLVVVWAYQDIWQKLGVPLSVFGLLWAISNLLVGLTARSVHRLEKSFSPVTLMALMGSFVMIGYLGLSSMASIVTAGFFVFFSVARGIKGVLMRDALNQRIPGEFRATANSLSQLGMRGLFCILGPITGYLLDHKGVQPAMSFLAGFYGLCFIFLLVPLLRSYKPVEP